MGRCRVGIMDGGVRGECLAARERVQLFQRRVRRGTHADVDFHDADLAR